MDDDDGGGGYMNPEDDFQQHIRQQFHCEVCGSEHFYNDGGGTYFCTECNTQSQQARQFIDEDLTLRAGNLRQVLTTSTAGAGTGGSREARAKRRKAKVVLTSWEVYNHVLKAMTEELIRMGFPALLRAKVFQLWSAYLVRRGVLASEADSSKNEADRIPCLSTFEPRQNVIKLLDQHRPAREFLRLKRQFKGISELDPTSVKPSYSLSVEKRLKTMDRKRAFESQHGSQPEDVLYDDGMTTTSPAAGTTASSGPNKTKSIRPRYTKPANILRRIYTKAKLQSLAPNYRINSLKRAPREYRAFQNLLKPETFSILHVFVILFVSLRQIGCKALFTDVLRLVDDGTLWVESLKRLMDKEEYCKIDANCNSVLNSIYKFRNPLQLLDSIELFNRYIGLRQFHFPTFEEFLPKFIDELALPREFECLLLQIDKMYPFDEDLLEIRRPRPRWKYLIEIPLLCRVGTFLRMLFGFDDVTERHQSKFARAVNTIMEELAKKNASTANSDWSKLFVIEDWFRFIRYRKRIVSAEIYNSRLYEPGKVPNLTRVQDIITRFGDAKETNMGFPPPQVRAQVKNYFSNIVVEVHSPIPEVPSYTSVQTATDAIFQTYLNSRPNVSYPEFKNEELLNMDFSKTRVDWIWNPQKYIPLLQKAGYQVKVVPGDARQYKEPILDDCIYVFQPYKWFDDYLEEKSQPSSLKFLLDTFRTALGPGLNVVELHKDLLTLYIFYFSELYCKRAHSKVIPLIH